MNHVYDVVIVGAGPAGGQCARDLSKQGKKVLLVDKAKDFNTNNYSSGGAPKELLQDYNLPSDVVGANWNQIVLTFSRDSYTWENLNYKGSVIEFKKLRSFLADEVKKNGSHVELNTGYHHHEKKDEVTLVHLRELATGQPKVVETKVLVDATGAERKVLQKGSFDRLGAVAATGIENLVEVDAETYNRYADKLSFFIGLKWMPQGYSWVFPAGNSQLKIGVIRYFSHEMIVPHELSYRYYLDHLLEKCTNNKYKLLDTHGKTLYYVKGQRDSHYHDNVIAIGDAISTLNPLASEGIRHAMYSGKIGAHSIAGYLEGQKNSFKEFSKEMHHYFGYRWKISEFVMNRMYREKNDHKLEKYATTFKKFNFNEMIDFAFNYDWKIALRFFWNNLV